jgi:uncharacterized RDD family membrane protein YckC
VAVAEHGVSPIPREARGYQGQPAGLVTRMTAAVLDGAVVVLALVAGYAVLAALLFMVNPRGFRLPDGGWLLSVSAGLLVLVVYLTAAWWISGRSYGCLVMGLRVVGHQGDNPRLLEALARALLCVAFPIGLLWTLVSRDNRSLQDLVLRTSVVYDWQPARPHELPHESEPESTHESREDT